MPLRLRDLPHHSSAALACAVVLCFWVSIAPASDGDPANDARDAAVAVDNSWSAVFDRREGWTGGDVAGTVNLGDRRILWLFGDSWIGSIRQGKRAAGARMVNNSIAIQPIELASPWRPPDAASLQFAWGANDAEGKPTAWAAPDNRGIPADRREWLWPTGGGLVVPGPANSRRLALFFFRVRRSRNGKDIWNFAVVGSAMGVVDNLSQPVQKWKLRLRNVPDSMTGAKRPGESAETTWGPAALVDPETRLGKRVDALIYGVRKEGAWNSSLILARAPAESIDQFETWKFYAAKNSWTATPHDAVGIAKGLVSEFSVEHATWNGRRVWILVQSEPLLGRRIFVRTSPKPEGPWSARMAVYTVPDLNRSRNYFTYAAKGHVVLSRPDELLVTYLVNSQRFGDLAVDTTIYRPKFIRVPFRNLMGR